MTILDPRATTVHTPDSTCPPQRRRRTGGFKPQASFHLFGAAIAGITGALVLQQVAALSSGIGVIVVAYVLFLVTYGVLLSVDDTRQAVTDGVMTVVLATAAIAAFSALGVVVVFTLVRGWAALSHLNFYVHDLSTAGPLAPLSQGGVGHAIVGTLWMVGIAVVITVPIGIVTALYLDLSRGGPAKFVRTATEAMTALPSILAGLFIYASWILTFGFQRSGLAASLALSVMMLPYITRASDLALRLVPANLREASAALGSSGWRSELQVVVPTARSGLATAVILGIARAIGEASPILLTAGYTTYLNANPLNGSMTSLSLATLKLVQSGFPSYTTRAFGCASVLLILVIVLFVIARKIGGWGPGHLTPRAARRVAADSARDAARFTARTASGAHSNLENPTP